MYRERHGWPCDTNRRALVAPPIDAQVADIFRSIELRPDWLEEIARIAGTGGNGGGALVAARHLSNRGVDVAVCVTNVDRLRPVPRQQFDIVNRLGIPVVEEPVSADMVIDGIIGYSLNGAPTGRSAHLIRWTEGREVLSLDAPSGVDVSSGAVHDPSVVATATGTLAAPKIGLRGNESTGELYVLDISVPPSVYAGLGFAAATVLPKAALVKVAG